MKATQISNAVQNVVPKSDPEAQKEEDSDELISWEDYYKDPCLFLPIICFTAAGFLGCILLIVAAVGAASSIIILIGGLVLFIMGFGAAWEIRAIGSLSDQIKRLKQLREKLQAQTMALQGQVVGMKEENEELEENVENFRNQNNHLETNVNAFDTANDNLRDTLSHLQGANSQLATDVSDLNEKNEELEQILVKMNAQKDKIEEDLKNFDELRHHMESMAEESGEQLHEMVSKTMSKFDSMDKLVRENERVLLRQIAADCELIDDQEGHSKKEFKRFLARLPKRYRAIVEEQNINFELLDKDNDNSIDPKELTNLIDRLIAANEEKLDTKKQETQQLKLEHQESEI